MKKWEIKIGSLPLVVIHDGHWVHLVANTAAFCSNLREVQQIAVSAGIPPWVMSLISPLIPRQPPENQLECTMFGITFRFGPRETLLSFVMSEQKAHEVFLLPFKETETQHEQEKTGTVQQ